MTGVKQIDKRVLHAVRAVDRSAFVRAEDRGRAFIDHPLEIGFGQTISQPFIVALITHLIEPKAQDRVLEVGSGSGYQAAILSKLCHEVFGIEVIKELAERSRENLAHEHITNVSIVCGDGNIGLFEHAPFHKIIVSAAASKLPAHLLDQLVVGGLMVLPKTISHYDQILIRVKKISQSEFTMTDILPVRFVPLVNS